MASSTHGQHQREQNLGHLVAEACRSHAWWRREMAEQCPGDPRQEMWARNLEAMAQWAERLSDSDERLLQLCQLCCVDRALTLSIGRHAFRHLARCDPDTAQGFDAFLTRLEELAEEDAVDLAKEAGRWPPLEQTYYNSRCTNRPCPVTSVLVVLENPPGSNTQSDSLLRCPGCGHDLDIVGRI